MAANTFDLTGLVRSLQRSEGHQDCFRRGLADCNQTDCAWRDLCLYRSDPTAPEEQYGEESS
jgi:hypothetical protein